MREYGKQEDCLDFLDDVEAILFSVTDCAYDNKTTLQLVSGLMHAKTAQDVINVLARVDVCIDEETADSILEELEELH